MQFFYLVYFKNLSHDEGKLFFSLKKHFIFQITVTACTVSLLLPYIHQNELPTSAFPTATTITSGLILLQFIACTSFPPHLLSYFAELVLLTDFRFHRRAFCSSAIHSVIPLPTSLQRQLGEADPLEVGSPKP